MTKIQKMKRRKNFDDIKNRNTLMDFHSKISRNKKAKQKPIKTQNIIVSLNRKIKFLHKGKKTHSTKKIKSLNESFFLSK